MRTAGPGSEPPLPETSWEVVSARGIMPDDLRVALKAPVAMLRVPQNIDAKLHDGRHVAALSHYQQLTATLAHWRYYRVDPRDPSKYQVYVEVMDEVETTIWLRIVVGLDRSGSWNLVTLFCTKARLVRRLVEAGEVIARA